MWMWKFRGRRYRRFRARVRRAAVRTDRIAQRRGWKLTKVKVWSDGQICGYGDNPLVDVVNFEKFRH